MAKFLMIQVQAVPYAGTAYLSGAVKEGGHQFRLCLSTDSAEVLRAVEAEKPDLVGFSCMTSFYKLMHGIASEIKKKFAVPIILGGAHPTYCPEVVREEPFDMICRGEGEAALVDLLNAIENGENRTNIRNIWTKVDGNVYENELRPLVEPLDQVPLVDWTCYEGTGVTAYPPIVHPIRGCPYGCSYCHNHAARELYRGLGKYVRYFSVERVIQEVEAALKFFSRGPVVFSSDSFGLELEWMESLFEAYSAKTDRPFFLLLHPTLITDRCVEILSRYRCCGVAIGVESGSERVREEVLNRYYSNELLLEVAQRLHDHGLKFRTYNMIGLPTETEDELWETIDINVKMKADFPRCAIYTSMPHTRLTEFAQEKGLLDADYAFDAAPASVFVTTTLKSLDKARIQNSLYFFVTAIKLPRLRNLVKWLTHTKPNFLYRFWFYLTFMHIHRKSEQRPFFSYMRFVIANRSSK